MLERILACVLSFAPCVAPQSSRPASAPARTPAVLKGRCVADEDGAPLPGCMVKLRGHGRSSAEVATAGEIRWQDPEPVTSGADGRFEVTFVPLAGYRYSLVLQAPDRVPRTGRWTAFEPGKVEDLGEIRVASGHRVRGKVVDLAGKPLPMVSVAVQGLPLPLPGARGANDRHICRSDQNGEFEFSVPLPTGRWPLQVDSPGHTLESPKEVAVGGSVGPLVLQVKRMPSISGVVLDEDGRPAPGVELQVAPSRGNLIESARSDKTGRFELFAAVPPDGKVQLTTWDPGAYEQFEPTDPVEWGTDTLRITVSRALSFELLVVDETGHPVEEFAVKCHSVRAHTSLPGEPRLGGRHPGGKVTVDKVWRGANKLVVVPTDPTLTSSEEIVVDAGEAPLLPIKIALLRKAGLTVRVLNRDGQPIAGSMVELVDTLGHPFAALSQAVDPRRARTTGRWPWPIVVGTATTDRLGRASVHLPPGAEGPLAVRVRGTDHATFVRSEIKPDAGQPMLELVAPRPARIQGKLVPASLASVPDLFAVVRTPGDRQRPDAACMVPITADGTFTFAQLPAEEVEIMIENRLTVRRKNAGGGSSSSSSNQVLKGLDQTVTLKEGETRTVVLEAAELTPARLEARVVDKNGAVATGAVILVLTSAAVSGRLGEFVLDERGWLDLPAALPGTYRASLRVSETRWVQLEGEFTLEPGKPVEWTFRVPADQ